MYDVEKRPKNGSPCFIIDILKEEKQFSFFLLEVGTSIFLSLITKQTQIFGQCLRFFIHISLYGYIYISTY